MTSASFSFTCIPALIWIREEGDDSFIEGVVFSVRSAWDSKVSDMSVNAPKGLFPSELKHSTPGEGGGGAKLKVTIIGAGLAGILIAVELLDQGHEVDIYEPRPFIGGKVGSFVDKCGNHIEMGLHVFFGCYNNLF